MKTVLTDNGFYQHDFIERISDQNVKEKLISNTENAVQKGIFGAPTVFVGDEMFFGKDKLWEVEELLND